MKKFKITTTHIVFVFSIAIIAMGTYYKNLIDEENNYIKKVNIKQVSTINCLIYPDGCGKHEGDFDFDLLATQQLKTLTPRQIVFSAGANNQYEPFVLRVDMVGMAMGDNLFKFSTTNNQTKADIVLPFCSVGRNDWIISVKLRHKITNKFALVHFRFTI